MYVDPNPISEADENFDKTGYKSNKNQLANPNIEPLEI